MTLFVDAWRLGGTLIADGEQSGLLPVPCHAVADLETRTPLDELPDRRIITRDPGAVVRAWMAVVSYLLSDARFVLE